MYFMLIGLLALLKSANDMSSELYVPLVLVTLAPANVVSSLSSSSHALPSPSPVISVSNTTRI